MSSNVAKIDQAQSPEEGRYSTKSIERAARLWSGVILMIFVTSHFLNHALGVFGVNLMSEVQEWRSGFWRSWVGTILLFGAAGTHIALGLWRVVSRRTWRMPPMEALQIILGVLIPILLLGHVVGTRMLSSLAGVNDSYVNLLRYFWPVNALMQSLALVVVWSHGVIGLYYAFHVRRWFKPLRLPFAILAVLIPALALAGFVAAGREAVQSSAPVETFTNEQLALQKALMTSGYWAIAAVLAFVAAIIAFRLARARLGGRVTVQYVGHGQVVAIRGLTLLEISRANRIPHPSACGGRGRCSSCRVLVLKGEEELAPPSSLERHMLERIRAPRQVRLACQIRPAKDLNVRVLLGSQLALSSPESVSESLDWGVEEDLTVLFADIRGFATLAENQMPADIIVLLSRIIGEMGQAVEGRGGRISMIQTDGIAAVFGMGGKSRAGSRAALHAAADILKAIHLVNKDVRVSLPLPIRIGIGVHSGPVLLSRAEDNIGGQRLVVIGETVVVASRLEEATKEFAADCIVSTRTIANAGLTAPSTGEFSVHYKNSTSPVLVHAFGDRQDLRALLGRKSDEPEPPKAEPVAA
jgi:adenylate cyclase